MIEDEVLAKAWYDTKKTAAQHAQIFKMTEGRLKSHWWRLKNKGLLPKGERKKYTIKRNPRPLPVKVRFRDNFDMIDGRPTDDGRFLERLRDECPDWKPGDPHP